MSSIGLAPEQMEQALEGCSDCLHAAADTLAEGGEVEAASAVRNLAEVDDLHAAGARSLLDLEGMDPETRDLTINAIWDVARIMTENGDRWNPGPLVVWLDEVTSLYGFPADRADADD